MNILYLNNGLAGGGIEKLLNDLLPIINANYYCELLILTDRNEKYIDSLRNNGINITIVPKTANNIIRKYCFIKAYILNNNFDIIHANGFPMIYYIAIIKKMLRKKCPPIVMTEHNTDNRRRHHKLLRPIEQFIYHSFSKIASISAPTQAALLDWLRIKDKRRKDFCVIYNGINIDQFKETAAVDRTSLLKSINYDDVLICMVGTFTQKKNHKIMISVMKQLPDNYKLLCLGEGPLKDSIMEEVEDNGLNERFIFLGFRTDVASIIKASDAIVIPSIWEGFGLIAAEAMACGVPVIASNVPGLADVVGDAGLLVTPTSSADIVEKILSFSNERKTLIERGYLRVPLFDINSMANSYCDLYESVIE